MAMAQFGRRAAPAAKRKSILKVAQVNPSMRVPMAVPAIVATGQARPLWGGGSEGDSKFV